MDVDSVNLTPAVHATSADPPATLGETGPGLLPSLFQPDHALQPTSSGNMFNYSMIANQPSEDYEQFDDYIQDPNEEGPDVEALTHFLDSPTKANVPVAAIWPELPDRQLSPTPSSLKRPVQSPKGPTVKRARLLTTPSDFDQLASSSPAHAPQPAQQPLNITDHPPTIHATPIPADLDRRTDAQAAENGTPIRETEEEAEKLEARLAGLRLKLADKVKAEEARRQLKITADQEAKQQGDAEAEAVAVAARQRAAEAEQKAKDEEARRQLEIKADEEARQRAAAEREAAAANRRAAEIEKIAAERVAKARSREAEPTQTTSSRGDANGIAAQPNQTAVGLETVDLSVVVPTAAFTSTAGSTRVTAMPPSHLSHHALSQTPSTDAVAHQETLADSEAQASIAAVEAARRDRSDVYMWCLDHVQHLQHYNEAFAKIAKADPTAKDIGDQLRALASEQQAGAQLAGDRSAAERDRDRRDFYQSLKGCISALGRRFLDGQTTEELHAWKREYIRRTGSER